MHSIPTRDNSGVELYESTLPSHDAFPWGTAMPLWAGDPEFKRYVRLGEVEYARVRGNEAKARIACADPGQFWRLYPRPFPVLLGRHAASADEKHFLAQEFLRQSELRLPERVRASGDGADAMKRRVPGAGLMALMFLLVPLPYYVVTVQPRFRHPIEPLIAVLAVYFVRDRPRARRKRGKTVRAL